MDIREILYPEKVDYQYEYLVLPKPFSSLTTKHYGLVETLDEIRNEYKEREWYMCPNPWIDGQLTRQWLYVDLDISSTDEFKAEKEAATSISELQQICIAFLEDNEEFEELKTALKEWNESVNEDVTILSSGSKGFHIYAYAPYLEHVPGDMLRHIIYDYFPEKMHKFIDMGVAVDRRRRLRVPGSINHKTGFECLVMQVSESMNLPGFKPLVEKWEHIIKLETQRKQSHLKAKKVHWQQINQHKRYEPINLDDINLIDVAEHLLGSGVETVKGKLFKCPVHNDTNPSLMVYENGFICGACDKRGNKLEFLEFLGYTGNERWNILREV